MSDLVVPRCPRCGAELRIDPGEDHAYCSYCDSQILVATDGPSIDSEYAELEKKKYALELEKKDLSALRQESANLSYRIKMAEEGPKLRNKKGYIPLMIVLLMVIMMDAIMFPLFYVLGISYVYGVDQEMCLNLGVTVLVVSIAMMISVKLFFDRSCRLHREEALRSPEYRQNREALREVERRIEVGRKKVEGIEAEIRSFLR